MKVAIIDSGIHLDHPHVGRVAGGVGIVGPDFLDRLGHGTAVAGAIREKAPEAEIYAVKVFDTRLSVKIDVILRALEWCISHQMDLINLSLGTANQAHRERFEKMLTTAKDPLTGVRGSVARYRAPNASEWVFAVVSAAHLLPGTLPNVIGVAPDPDCPRDEYRYRDGVYYASPYPRSIPGVPVERNLHGASFAVANMTGLIARGANNL